MREEIGDAAYDQYLFAAGVNNRVSITNVINGSAAYNAGIESGDLILSYAGRRIFTTRELQESTREGVRGEGVSVTLQRGDQRLDISVSRGPLGVTLSREIQEP